MKYAVILSVCLLTGCSTYQGIIADKGAEGADDALQAAMWAICEAATVGSVRRKFDSPQERSDYEKFCDGR